MRKYQKDWEKEFTIVHYDQRGSGKSYQFFRDYSGVSAHTHVKDLTELVTEMKIPVYFLMGQYDGMTSPKVAEEYLKDLSVEYKDKTFILFEESAHFPQFEEKEKFGGWMKETFIQ